MTKRPLLYIAAPYTYPDPVMNTHYVSKVAMEIYTRSKWVPLIPHLNIALHFMRPTEAKFWYELDLHYLDHCDAIVRLPGYSEGADNEIEYAIHNGIDVVDFEQLPMDARYAWHAWQREVRHFE